MIGTDVSVPAGAPVPATRAHIDEENPWPGLSAFDEAAERFFNGRAQETAALRRLVAQGPLTVLFGASGLGKTSLLQAGLFPLLRRELRSSDLRQARFPPGGRAARSAAEVGAGG